ncbi:hypothetical protein G9A89_011054 [Geosiphon pyriformis]|nr:hypothetical protein G9A89_011054 [Geosiphon pyriformis]
MYPRTSIFSGLFKNYTKLRCSYIITKGFHASPLRKDVTPLRMPALSPTMLEGSVTTWLKEEGQAFAAGDPLLEIETDKAQMTVEASDDGIMAKILTSVGQRCPVGTIIALTAEADDDISNIEIPADLSPPSPKPAMTPESVPPVADHRTSLEHSAPLSPAVLHILTSNGVKDVTKIIPTGPKGRLLKGDVLAFLGKIKLIPPERSLSPAEQAAAQPIKKIPKSEPKPVPGAQSDIPSEYTDEKLSSIRKDEAERLNRSKSTIPHSYIKKDVTVDELFRFREKLNEQLKTDVSINDLFVKAASLALRGSPKVNVQYDPELDSLTVQNSDIDVGLAVSTSTGVTTPVINKADEKGLQTISELLRELSNKGKDNQLSPEEYRGGSFSISNLGAYGVDDFTGIINPPQSSILAIGSARSVAKIPDVVDITDETMMNGTKLFEYLAGGLASRSSKFSSSAPSDNAIDIIEYLGGVTPTAKSKPQSLQKDIESKISPRVETSQVVTVQLSIDARTINETDAAEFLNRFAAYVESPARILL